MHIRKVQVTGRSSFILTLPKDWIKAQNIQKNQEIKLISQPDGSLLIAPHMKFEENPRIKTFEIDKKTNVKLLLNQLFAAYIVGFSQIKILTTERIPHDIREIVFKFVNSVIGLEIIEETELSYVIKDVLKAKEATFDKEINRMVAILRSMHKDAIEALEMGNRELAISVMERDRQINRMNRHITRQTTMSIEDVGFAESIETSMRDVLAYFVIALYLELIGDYTVLIAREVVRFQEAKYKISASIGISTDIGGLSNKVLELLELANNSWNEQNIPVAQEAIDRFQELHKECDKMLRKLGDAPVSINNIIENIRKTGKLIQNIAFITIDRASATDL